MKNMKDAEKDQHKIKPETSETQPKPTTHHTRLLTPLMLAMLVMLIGMSAYELIKQMIFPEITIGQSHIVTIMFSAVIATIAAYFVLRKYQILHQQLVKEITEHKRAEEELKNYHDHLEELVADRTAELQKEITDRKRAEEELQHAKDIFSSIIAHDLRGPLGSFCSLIQTISKDLDSYSPDELRETLKLQQTVADNLYELVENLLTWSRIQRGTIEYCPQYMDVGHVVAQNVKLFMPTAEQKQIMLTNSIQDQTFVYADFNMVNTVFRNLISNALKFTKAGGTVDVSAAHDENFVNVSVSDTGIGIADQNLPKLFRIDAKYRKPGTAGEEGTGLGLILCKEFVEKHGGRIWVESKVGKGATFTFTLPKKPVE